MRCGNWFCQFATVVAIAVIFMMSRVFAVAAVAAVLELQGHCLLSFLWDLQLSYFSHLIILG